LVTAEGFYTCPMDRVRSTPPHRVPLFPSSPNPLPGAAFSFPSGPLSAFLEFLPLLRSRCRWFHLPRLFVSCTRTIVLLFFDVALRCSAVIFLRAFPVSPLSSGYPPSPNAPPPQRPLFLALLQPSRSRAHPVSPRSQLLLLALLRHVAPLWMRNPPPFFFSSCRGLLCRGALPLILSPISPFSPAALPIADRRPSSARSSSLRRQPKRCSPTPLPASFFLRLP